MRLLIEATVAILLLSAVIARADTLSFGQPASPATPAATGTPKPGTPATPSAPATGTPTTQPTTRAPSSLDTNNTYHTTGGILIQGTPGAKEPVIDGKAIPKTIEFNSNSSGDKSTKPVQNGTARTKKRPTAKKPRRGRGQAEQGDKGKDEEDDGL